MSFNQNLSQSTYNRLSRAVRDVPLPEAKFHPNPFDVLDLLEAYETAVHLLDEAIIDSGLDAQLDARISEFLYAEQGDPKVVLTPDETEL